MSKKIIILFIITLLVLVPITAGFQVNNEDYNTTVEKLPYYLEGTVLDGSLRVIITEDGEPLQDLDPSLYDLTLSFDEEQKIINNARQKYISTFGIDPLKTEEDDKTSFRKNIILEFIDDLSNHFQKKTYVQEEIINLNSNLRWPHQIDGKLILLFVPASDTESMPPNIEQLWTQSQIGFKRFERFGVKTETVKMLGIWDASDVPSKTSGEYLWDLMEDCGSYRTADNMVMMGWTKTFSDKYAGRSSWEGIAIGRAEAKTKAHALTQHELSHCFGAPDHGWVPPMYIFPLCIMNYLWVSLGIMNIWCDSCKDTINSRIWS